jgi:hypothetical protein
MKVDTAAAFEVGISFNQYLQNATGFVEDTNGVRPRANAD